MTGFIPAAAMANPRNQELRLERTETQAERSKCSLRVAFPWCQESPEGGAEGRNWIEQADRDVLTLVSFWRRPRAP